MTGEGMTIAMRATRHQDTDFAWLLYRDLMKPLTEELHEWDDVLQRRLVENDMASGEASIILVDRRPGGWMRVREAVDHLTIHQLYLAPQFQNQRVGTAIIEQLIQLARHSQRRIHLEVTKNNRARRLYERLGFVVTRESTYKLEMTWHGGTPA